MIQHISSNRNETLDAIKAFAIMCVVLGHCIQFGSGDAFYSDQLYFENVLFRIIYSFHMPLFMVVSGYLFYYSAQKLPWYGMIAKKARSLIVPIAVWSILSTCIVVCSTLYRSASFPGISELLRTYGYYFLTSLWFLWSLFWNAAIVSLVRRFLKDSVIAYALLLIVLFFIPDSYNLSLYKYMYPYFILGYLFCKGDWKTSVLWNKKLLLCASGLLYIALLFLYDKNAFIYVSKFRLINGVLPVGQQIFIDLYRWIVGLLGTVFFIQLIRNIYPLLARPVKTAFLVIGQNTMGIYIISNYLFSYVVLHVTSGVLGPNVWCILGEFIIVTGMSLAFSILLKKSKLLGRLLLGQL